MFYQKKCRLPKKMPVFKSKPIDEERIWKKIVQAERIGIIGNFTFNETDLDIKEVKKPNVKLIVPVENTEINDKKVTKRRKSKKTVSESEENN